MTHGVGPRMRARLAWLLLALAFLAGPPAAQAFERHVDTVALQELPTEAVHTLALIHRGGPFPFRRDGVVFQNRERRLPRQPYGYYREYTVPTPGARDRGARRIIAGRGQRHDVRTSGEYYYTGDHYRSFRRIEEQP